ncbi:hypothetical protein [Nocardioides sp. B-3]|uniref:hypothetical protein n=1 Tax=Nocardioides sp. B-3 TaxID=2895565 RepID=UPI0021535D92|nr:hypothetical protein [Nocardioides sp. B-3]UUZ59383.1 hypothetical protein LP418_26820 [Nocardioides sp. B-3]
MVKTVSLLPCAEYDRYSNPEPPLCDWIITPPKPTKASIAAAMARPSDSPVGPALLIGGVGLGVAAAIRFAARRRRT